MALSIYDSNVTQTCGYLLIYPCLIWHLDLILEYSSEFLYFLVILVKSNPVYKAWIQPVEMKYTLFFTSLVSHPVRVGETQQAEVIPYIDDYYMLLYSAVIITAGLG